MGYATERFAKRLKQIRETAGLTQEQFAKELGVSRGTISYYEKGERTPDIEFLDSLYDYFQCTVPFDFLLGNTDNIKEEHRNMYDFYGLTDKACDELDRDNNLGHLISAILGHRDFYALHLAYEDLLKYYKTFNISEIGYAGFLISDALNKIIFDSLEFLMGMQYTAEEREALRIKHDLNQKEFDKKRQEWAEYDRLMKEKWEKEDEELAKKDMEENATQYSSIDKIHEKFHETVDHLEFCRQYH